MASAVLRSTEDEQNEVLYRTMIYAQSLERNRAALQEDTRMINTPWFDCIISGSGSEKSELPHWLLNEEDTMSSRSDIDLMLVLKHVYVGNNCSLFCALDVVEPMVGHDTSESLKQLISIDGKWSKGFKFNSKYHLVIQIETEKCRPGYARLRSSEEFKMFIMSLVKNNYSSVKKSKANISEYVSNDLFFNIVDDVHLQRHGPALQHLEAKHEDTDYVYALRCPYIPSAALAMIKRTPKSGFPDAEMKSKVLLRGCLLVAVGHKLSKTASLEWRISFSEAETELCLSWNRVQLFTYRLMKLLKFKHFNGLIPSYHLKTCLFYCVENFDSRVWCRAKLVLCIQIVLKYLIGCLECKCLPNYFIPANNMVEHWKSDDFEKLLLILQQIVNDSSARQIVESVNRLSVGEYIGRLQRSSGSLPRDCQNSSM